MQAGKAARDACSCKEGCAICALGGSPRARGGRGGGAARLAGCRVDHMRQGFP